MAEANGNDISFAGIKSQTKAFEEVALNMKSQGVTKVGTVHPEKEPDCMTSNRRHFTKKQKFEPHGGARGKVFIQGIKLPNFRTIRSIVALTFNWQQKMSVCWRRCRSTVCWIRPLETMNVKISYQIIEMFQSKWSTIQKKNIQTNLAVL